MSLLQQKTACLLQPTSLLVLMACEVLYAHTSTQSCLNH